MFAMIRLRLLAATPSTGLSHSAGNGRCGSYASKPDRTITSGLPTIRPESADLLSRNGIRKLPVCFLVDPNGRKEELGEEDRPL